MAIPMAEYPLTEMLLKLIEWGVIKFTTGMGWIGATQPGGQREQAAAAGRENLRASGGMAVR